MINKYDIIKASISLRATIGDSQWMQANQASILEPIPSSWVSAGELELPLGCRLRSLGVNWTTTNDLVIAFMYLERLGLVESWSNRGDARSLLIRRTTGWPG